MDVDIRYAVSCCGYWHSKNFFFINFMWCDVDIRYIEIYCRCQHPI